MDTISKEPMPVENLEITDRTGRFLYQAILVRSLDILSADEQTALDTLLDDNATTPKEVISFLQSKIPTFTQLVEEERNNLHQEVVSPTKS